MLEVWDYVNPFFDVQVSGEDLTAISLRDS
jgi:hypothetical protein